MFFPKEPPDLVRKRVMSVLDHEPPDRLPVYDSFWPEFSERWRREKGLGPDVTPEDYYFVDIAVVVAREEFFPTRRRVLREEDDVLVRDDGWGRIVRTRRGGYFYEELSHELDDPRKLDRLSFDPPDLDLRYAEFSKAVEREKAKRCVFCKIGGPYIRSSFVRGTEAFLVDLVRDEAFARELVLKVAGHLVEVGKESLRRGRLQDTGVWIYDDMGSSRAPMFSPRTFERVFYPAYRWMVGELKEAGARKVVLHSDGNIEPFLDMLVEAGIDAINPVEPQAGMDLVRLKEKYAGKLAFVGGVDNAHVLPSEDPKAIRSHILRLCEAGRDGGVILGAHSIGPDVSTEAYEVYRATALRFKAT